MPRSLGVFGMFLRHSKCNTCISKYIIIYKKKSYFGVISLTLPNFFMYKKLCRITMKVVPK